MLTLSLVLSGPPFTHPAIPLRSHYLGSPSPRHDPTRYLSCVSDLLETFRLTVQYPAVASSDTGRNGQVVPLVLNTQGWVKGLGMDLLLRIIGMARVTCEFEFDVAFEGAEDRGWDGKIPVEGGWGRFRRLREGADEEEEEALARGEKEKRRFVLEQIPPSVLSSRYTASDLRLLSLLSYFHASFPSPSSSSSALSPSLSSSAVSLLASRWDFSTPIFARRPWAVDPAKAFSKGVYLVGPGSEEVEGELVWRALEGAIVGVVAVEEDEDQAASSSVTSPLYIQGRSEPLPSHSRFLGLALVHSIVPSSSTDASPPTLHLTSPLPISLLAQPGTALLKGETELPLSGMLDWRRAREEEQEASPFLEVKGEGEGVIGSGRRKVRKNVGRRGGG